MVLAFESWVLVSPFKEVFECRLLVTQGLLERDAGHIIEPKIFGLFLECGQSGVGLGVSDFFLMLIEGIGTPAKDVIIDKSGTAERLSKQCSLFRGGVETVFVGALCHPYMLAQLMWDIKIFYPKAP